MAGTIICDFIRTDANKLSLNVGNTTFATINASGFFSNTGTQLIAANGAISGASVIASSIPTAAIADASITNAKLSLSANDSNIKTALNASGSAGIYACRAWVNFNATGTIAIRASGNISSITDNGTSDYTINITTAMPDINYAITASASVRAGVRTGAIIGINSSVVGGWADFAPTTTACRISLSDDTSTNYDPTHVCVSIFR